LSPKPQAPFPITTTVNRSPLPSPQSGNEPASALRALFRAGLAALYSAPCAMSYPLSEICDVCGNHAVVVRQVQAEPVRECEFCGHMEGPPDLIELLELQNEADGLGVSIDAYPLAQFIEKLPGVRILGDSGGDRRRGTMPFIAFELADHRTWQLENLGQALRLMRG